MKREDVVKAIREFTNNYNQSPEIWFDYEFADLMLKEIEKYMEPKFGGKQQSSYDLAMGNPCKWDE